MEVLISPSEGNIVKVRGKETMKEYNENVKEMKRKEKDHGEH